MYAHSCLPLLILTQPAYEGFSHQSCVPQVPHVGVKVIEHRPVGPPHHAAVKLCYVLTQGQDPRGPTTPLIDLKTKRPLIIMHN